MEAVLAWPFSVFPCSVQMLAHAKNTDDTNMNSNNCNNNNNYNR